MTVTLNVQAEIIGIRTDTPQPGDIFFVDTNVWLWQTYPNATTSFSSSIKKSRYYTAYLSAALSNGATLTYSGLILSELAHVIEKTERDIYSRSYGAIQAKEYRHNLTLERAKVVAEVQAAWSQVEAIAVPVDLTIDEATTNAALTRFQTQALDGYDLLMLEGISRAGAGQVKIITDDMDYAVVPEIQVFTSNNSVIQSAIAQNKLLVR